MLGGLSAPALNAFIDSPCFHLSLVPASPFVKFAAL